MLGNRVAVITCLMTLVGSANGQVFKCVENGKVTFSEIPCTGNSSGTEISVRPSVIEASDVREQVLNKQVQDLQGELSQQRQPVAAAEDRANSSACKQATRSYENEAGSIRNDQDLIASKRSAMFIACGQQEPTTVTIKNVYPQRRQGVLPTQNLNNCGASGCRDSDVNQNSKNESFKRGGTVPNQAGTPKERDTRIGCVPPTDGAGASRCSRGE